MILVKAQKEKRRAEERAPVSSVNIRIIVNRMWVKIWILEAILVRSQMEKRNKFLEIEGHII